MRHSRAGLNKDISLCPFGVRMIEVRLHLYISTRVCEIILSGTNVCALPRFRASVPKLFGIQANLATSAFCPT
jgi:hypothetical protein